MNSAQLKPPHLSQAKQSIFSPKKQSTSIISNILAKAEKQPNLKNRISIENDHQTKEARTATLKNSPQAINSTFRKNSLVFITSNGRNKKNKDDPKAAFHKNLEKDIKAYFIDDPDVSLVDISRFLRKKLYRKAFYVSEKFLSSRRPFRLFYEIRYNRLQLVIVNKLCKVKFFKNQPNHPQFVHKLLIKGLMAFRNYCNFLTIFLNKKYPHYPKKIVAEEQECDPYLSSNEEIFVVKNKEKMTLMKNSSRMLIVDTGASLRKGTSSFSMETIHEKLEIKTLFDGEYREDDEYFDKVMMKEHYELKKISDQAETFYFMQNLFEIMINFAILYRNMGEYKLSYNYLCQLNDYSKDFDVTVNPELLHSLIKCKFLLGIFYSQFEKYEESLIMLNQALFLCQKELIIRLNMNIYTKDVKRKSRMNFLSCVRTLVMILFSIAIGFAHMKKYRKMQEALELANMFAEKFLQRIDLLRKFISKIYSNLEDTLSTTFQEVAEMERIIKEFLINNVRFQKKLNEIENPIKIETNENAKTVEEINDKLYNKFSWGKLNKTQLILIPSKSALKEPMSPSLLRKDSSIVKKSPYMKKNRRSTITDDYIFTRANTENNEPLVSHQDVLNGNSFLKDEDDSGLDLFTKDASFICLENPILEAKAKTYKEIMDKTSIKPGISKNTNDNLNEYKPKVLTTNKYFKKYSDKNEDEKTTEVLKNPSSTFQKTEQPREETKTSDRDLDFYIGGIIENNFAAKYNCKNIDKIDDDFHSHLKNEDFDKKEFSYCKKMLLMKKQENCAIKLPSHQKKPNPLNKITTNNVVETEAGVIEGKITQEKQNDNFRQNLRNYQKILSKQIQYDENESQSENLEFKMPKVVEMLFKHKEELGLSKVAKAYTEKIKEKEKIEKKALEENLKKQNQLNKKQDFYNFKSIQTLKHLLDNKKISQSSYFLSKSHRPGKARKSWISSYKTNNTSSITNLNFKSCMGSKKIEKFSTPQNKSPSEVTIIEEDDKKIVKNFEMAQNMIKIFSSDFEKMREQYERKKGFKKIEKDEKIGALSTTDRTACQLAKSSFYMSLDNKNYTKKIMTFSELVKIKAKQHFKASSNFFGNSVFGTSFN